MAPIRIYERSSAPDGGGPQRFSDIDQVGDLLRPGSIVCLASNAEDVLVAERDGGPTSASWRLAVRPTGWSAREYNGLPTYAHDYLVESLPVEMLFVVVRNAGSIGFASLAAGGRMLQAGESPAGPPALGTRTPANWGSSEAWERQRSEGAAAAPSTRLVSARWKTKALGFTPLLVSALPTRDLARAEAYWGGLLFAAREQAREAVAATAEGEAQAAEQLRAMQRQLTVANSRLEELESRLALGQEASGWDSTAADLPACASLEGGGAGSCNMAPDSGAAIAVLQQHLLEAQEDHETQVAALQAVHAAEVDELQSRLAAAEQALADMATARDAQLAAARDELAARDAELRQSWQDRHRLDAALHVIKGMALAAKQCSPSTSEGAPTPDVPAGLKAPPHGVAPPNAAAAMAALEAAAAALEPAVAESPNGQQQLQQQEPTVEYSLGLSAEAEAAAAGEEPSAAGPSHRIAQPGPMPPVPWDQASAALRWLEQQDEVLLPSTTLDPTVRRLMDEELMISFRPQGGEYAAADAGADDGAEAADDDELSAVDVGPGCRLVTYADGHPAGQLDEAALNRILDGPLDPPESRRQARVYASLASAPASPTTEASADGLRPGGGWNAGALSLPATAIKGEQPGRQQQQQRDPMRDLLRASAAVQEMGASSSPKAADALAELMADKLVLRASLQGLPGAGKARKGAAVGGNDGSSGIAALRHSAPAGPAAAVAGAKPRSSFLQRSHAIDVFSL